MAVLEKIRVKMGVFITVLIGLALLSFIIDPATLETAVSMFSSKYDVGKINGESVSYQDYQKKIDYYTNIYQITNGGASINDQVQEDINNSAWQDFVVKYAYMPAYEGAGVAVGEDEMVDLIKGSEISPIIMNDPHFMGTDGSFDVARVYEFLNALPMDQSGQLAAYWDFLETQIYRSQLSTKYMSLMEKSAYVTPLEKVAEIDNNNIASTVQFVMKPVAMGPDSTIVVANSEIKSFYDNNKKNYKREASRGIEYVAFEVVPSEEDINVAKEDIMNVYEDFKTTDNVKAFLTRNSEKPLDAYYYTREEFKTLNSKAGEFIAGAKMGETSPVFQEGNTFMAARIADIRQMPDSVAVKHILIREMTQEASQAKADSLLAVLKNGGDIDQIAVDYPSFNLPNAKSAADLGWVDQRVAEYIGLEELMTAPLNEYKIFEGKYGIHIAIVSERRNVEERMQIALLTKEATASDKTYQSYYYKANELATKSNSNREDFNAAAKELGYSVQSFNNLAEGAKSFKNFKNTRDLSRWAYEAKVGDVSSVISADNKYFFVASLTDIKDRGYRSLSEVTPEIKNYLSMQKKAEKLAAEVAEQIKGLSTMEEIAEKLGLTVSTKENMTFGAQGSFALEPAFIGAASNAQVGVISAPVAGKFGVYVFKVLDRQTGAYFTEDDAVARIAQRSQQQMKQADDAIFTDADIEDNRGRFF